MEQIVAQIFTVSNIFWFLIGVFVGFLTAYIPIIIAYRTSELCRHLQEIAHATMDLSRAHISELNPYPVNTGAMRNGYRFSMGVVIDNIATIDPNGLNEWGVYPSLLLDDDRWSMYQTYVAPILAEIEPYSALLVLRHLRVGDWEKLYRLRCLCRDLRNAIRAVDVAFAFNPCPLRVTRDGLSPNYPLTSSSESALLSVDQAYKQLYKVWIGWKQLFPVDLWI